MKDLTEVEWTIQIMEEYILQVDDLGDSVKEVLNQETDGGLTIQAGASPEVHLVHDP